VIDNVRGEDSDPGETREWLEALEGVVRRAGEERGLFLLKQIEDC
jgi:pyruvate dehydrogenase E1 component